MRQIELLANSRACNVTGALRAALHRLRTWTPLLRQRERGSLIDATVWTTRPTEPGAVLEEPAAAPVSGAVDRDLAPIFGEFAWHSLTADARLLQISEDHYRLVAGLLN